MWRIHKYYSKELLANLSLTFGMLFGITMLTLLARGISRAPGQSILIALWITLLWSIDTVPHLLSISLLVATVFTFGRAAAENEITALRMAGISPLRLMGSLIFVGALASSINCYLLNNLIPLVHYWKYRPKVSLLKQFFMNRRSTTNSWEFQGVTMRWRSGEKNILEDLSFKLMGKSEALRIGRIGQGRSSKDSSDPDIYEGFARSAEFGEDASGRFLILSLRDIQIFGYEKDPSGRFRQSLRLEQKEEQIGIDLEVLTQEGRRSEGSKDLPSTQLVAEYVRRGNPRPKRIAWLFWDRGTRGLVCLLFALVGFPIGVLCRRAGRMAAFAFSFLPLGFYYLLQLAIAPWLARSLDSTLPVLLPDLSLLGIAWILIRRVFRT